MTPFYIFVVILVSLIIGFAKGGLSSLGLIAIPLLSLTMNTNQAVATVLPLLIVGDVFAVWTYWLKWDNRIIMLLLPPGIIGALLGSYWLVQIPETTLRRLIGGLTILYVIYRIVSSRLTQLDYTPPAWVGVLAGFAAGVTSALANAGGPPYAAYLLLKRVTPTIFVASFAIFFAIVNVIKVPPYIHSGLLQWQPFLNVIWSAPLIPVGVWLGRRFIKWVPELLFNRLVLAMLFITGVVLMI